MHNYLLNMITQSLHEYLALFRFPIPECPYVEEGTIIYYDPMPHAPRFIVRLYQAQAVDADGGKIDIGSAGGDSLVEFEPPLGELSDAVLEGVQNILGAINSIPKISRILYGPDSLEFLQKVAKVVTSGKSEAIWDVLVRGASDDDPALRHIKVEDSIIQSAEAELRDYCLKCFKVVEEYVSRYQVYKEMYSEELETSINEFFAKEHSFDDYCEVYCIWLMRLISVCRKFKSTELFQQKYLPIQKRSSYPWLSSTWTSCIGLLAQGQCRSRIDSWIES